MFLQEYVYLAYVGRRLFCDFFHLGICNILAATVSSKQEILFKCNERMCFNETKVARVKEIWPIKHE